MGKPSHLKVVIRFIRRQTLGTETSQYREEEKSTEIPIVAVSEVGIAQTIGTTVLTGL